MPESEWGVSGGGRLLVLEAGERVAGDESAAGGQLFRWAKKEDWSKVQIIRCGVDDAYLDAPVTPVPNTKRLVSVGRLSEQKDQLILVRAVAELVRCNVDVELVLVGDGDMRGDIEQVIQTHRLAQHVRITGYLSGDAVKQEILAARAFVLPRFAEGLPVAIMEALALSRPVVSTYVAGIPELVVPGETRWLVPAGSVDALVPVLEEVLRTPCAEVAGFPSGDSLDAMAARGRARVRAEHDVRVSAKELAALFAT